MLSRNTIFIIAFLAIIFVFFSTVYTVTEGEQALLLHLGNIETDASGKALIEGPGLHFKLPIITQAYIFDMRLQTLDIKSSRIMTAEQKDVIVDYFVNWRIANPALYYTRTGGDITQANLLLQQQLNSSLRAEFGNRTISQVVSDDRAMIMNTLSQEANTGSKNLGISVVDVRIKGIDLPDEVSTAVFERMKTGRERVASQFRADGKAQAEAIRANADGVATVTIAKAKAQAANIRSTGDAQAAKIYADAYSQNPDFFAFLRSLQAYKAVFTNTQNNILVLRPDNQFFKYFNGDEGQAAAAPAAAAKAKK